MASTEFNNLISELESSDFTPLADLSAERARFEESTALIPLPAGVDIRELVEADVRGEWVVTQDAEPEPTGPVVLYMHGGGFTVGSSKTCRSVTCALARQTSIPVLSIDYGLLPETTHGEAVEDVVRAYRWLRSRGHSPERVALAGDSAGATLALAAMLHLRDIEPLPECAYLLSPGADLTDSGWLAPQYPLRDPSMPVSLMKSVQRDLESTGVGTLHPLVSPLYADLRGLPPLLVQVGGSERLRDSILRLAGKARRDGVEVVLQEWDGMFHNWATLSGVLPEADEALGNASAFLVGRLLQEPRG